MLFKDLQGKADGDEVKELSDLLANPTSRLPVQSLLAVHDIVALKRFGPTLLPLPKDLDEERDSVKIIQLLKTMEPLGATVKRDEGTGAVVVARIMRGGAADRSGMIHEGDQLREVNGVLMDDKKPEDIVPIVARSRGAVTFKVVPSIKEDAPGLEKELFVRALFDYDPQEDEVIPCKEAGLAFRKGAVLQLLKWEEPVWWQARLCGGANLRAGLVPSKQLQERRFLLQRATARVQQKTSKQRWDGEGQADYGAISGIHIGLFSFEHCPSASCSGSRRRRAFGSLAVEALPKAQVRAPGWDACQSQGQGLFPMIHLFSRALGKGMLGTNSIKGFPGLRRSFRLSKRNWRAELCECGRSKFYDLAGAPTYEEVAPYRRQPESPHRLVLLVEKPHSLSWSRTNSSRCDLNEVHPPRSTERDERP
ncbi:hypothetical protein SKAU_G00380820 [Synaphobranchus kaupii]|uniref:MAGUK p55 subfamily member 7 n=1 Tax=Synaphobranchus kaupii TaxID=118154 RepID=A0A9Q1EDL1_SYNKA|nr:hypothetical protein SKAU_G00380820 [Synaphobranchus kaupii]